MLRANSVSRAAQKCQTNSSRFERLSFWQSRTRTHKASSCHKPRFQVDNWKRKKNATIKQAIAHSVANKKQEAMKQKRMMGRQRSGKLGQAVTLVVLLAISIELLCAWCLTSSRLVEARYFPTRSDDSSVQVLKDLIRSIIEQSRSDVHSEQQLQQPIGGLRSGNQQRLGSLLMVDAGGPQAAYSQLKQARLQRRVAEWPLDSGNDNEPFGQFLSNTLPRSMQKTVD